MDVTKEDLSAEEERFKTALHHSVGKLCQYVTVNKPARARWCVGEELPPLKFTKPFMAMLTEVTWSMMEHWSKDAEAFAKHAKRTTVNADDVRLLARRSPSLMSSLETAAGLQAKPGEAESARNGKQKGSQKRPRVVDSEGEPAGVCVRRQQVTSMDDDLEPIIQLFSDDDDEMTRKSNQDHPVAGNQTPATAPKFQPQLTRERTASWSLSNDRLTNKPVTPQKPAISPTPIVDFDSDDDLWNGDAPSTSNVKQGPNVIKRNVEPAASINHHEDEEWDTTSLLIADPARRAPANNWRRLSPDEFCSTRFDDLWFNPDD